MSAIVVPVQEMFEQRRVWNEPDGAPTTTSRRVPVVLDDAAEPIREFLRERHDVLLDRLLESVVEGLDDRWPWAWILFRDCYPLAGHLRFVRRDAASTPFTLYGQPPEPPPPGWTPCVGAAMPMTKEILRELAQRSPMFESSWAALEHRDAHSSWLCLSAELRPEWVATVSDRVSAG